MATLTNIFHTNLLTSLRSHRRITLRHILLTLGLSAVLSILYYTYLGRNGVFLSSEEIIFWPPETPELWAERAAHVKEAFRHAYHGYEQHAFPHDELMPTSNLGIDK